VALKAGERRKVVFELAPRDLSFVTADGVHQILPGKYSVSVGSGQPGTGVASQSAVYTATSAAKIPE